LDQRIANLIVRAPEVGIEKLTWKGKRSSQIGIITPKVSNSIMNRSTILLVACIVVTAGCSRLGIKGDGVITTTNRPIADFSTLEAAGAYQIQWSSGKPALTISTDQNLLPLITTSITGNSLHIDCKENLRPTKGITIIVSSASLTDVQLNGAVSVTASNLSGEDLKLESNGASSIVVDGSVTNLEADLSGATRLNGKSLHAQTARVSLNGAAYADVTVTETLNASISGAGVLTYGGDPKSVEKNVGGVGRIQARK
jgi:hypothetical protein